MLVRVSEGLSSMRCAPAVFTVAWNVDLKYGFYVGFGIPIILTAFSFYAAPQASSTMHHCNAVQCTRTFQDGELA